MHALGDTIGCLEGKIWQQGNSGSRVCCRPMPRNAAIGRSNSKNKHSRIAADLDDRRAQRVIQVSARACCIDAHSVQRCYCLGEPGITPVEDVVICENTAVNVCRSQAAYVCGMHSVVDSLGFIVLTRSDACFEIDDPDGWGEAVEILDSLTPDMIEVDRLRNRPIGSLGHHDVFERRLHIGFIEAEV